MKLIRSGDDALRYCMATRYDQVVVPQIKLLDGKRHDRQIFSKMTSRKRQILNERSSDPAAPKAGAVDRRQKVDNGKQVGFGEDLQQFGEDAF